MAILYELPRSWIAYDPATIRQTLTEAKAAILALVQMPYQRSWAEGLQQIQLKREVAGTSRIEGAEFTERELEAALRDTPEDLATRSQKQAAAAVATYRWISGLPADQPVDGALIAEIHRRLVTGCDDDHCPPGQLRGPDQNVTFGHPRHRGATGGEECARAFAGLAEAAEADFRDHDPLIRALASHYHLGAMHPFLDGNGRTARAVEALMLQRVGLRDTLFIAMSNYYYEEKPAYLQALGDSRARDHDLTPFLAFALPGIEIQCRRLLAEIRSHVVKALYRNTMTELFGRLKSPRKRVMTGRHIQILSLLLDEESLTLRDLVTRTAHVYLVKNPMKALIRDLNHLIALRTMTFEKLPEPQGYRFRVNLDWPTQITETEFFRRAQDLPRGKVLGFLSGGSS